MNKKKFFLMLTVIIILTLTVFSKDYVVLIHSGVNIRTGPGTLYIEVGKASKGQLYHFMGETGNWYKIELFSGEIRYVSKSLSAKLGESEILPQHYFILPPKESKQRSIYKRILRARSKAEREAAEIIPVSVDPERYRNYNKILEDRYVLKIFRNHRVHPALYCDLITAGTKKGWN